MQTPPVIVLTGVTDGLGRIAALELAPKGACLALVVRGQPKDALIVNVASRASRRAGAQSPSRTRPFSANCGRPPSNSCATCDTSFDK